MSAVARATPAHDVAGVAHRARDDAQHTRARRCSAFTVDNRARAIRQHFKPREIVKVLDGCRLLQLQRSRHTPMDDSVIRRGEATRKLHREPVFLARLAAEREPRQMAQRRIQQRMLTRRQLGIRLRDLEADTPRAAMRQQRQILARLQPKLLIIGVETECAPLDEVIAAARCAELDLRLDLERLEQPRRLPGRVCQHGMIGAVAHLPALTHAEACAIQQRVAKIVAPLTKHIGRDVID